MEGTHPTPIEIDLVDRALVETLAPLGDLARRYHQATMTGLEHIPREGPALLVANHGIFGADAFILGLEIYRRTGRLPRGLVEHFFFKIPALGALMQRLGGLRGTRAHGVAALRAGELVLVYPGGAREVNKTSAADRYKLFWGKSMGFVRVAVAAQAPVVFIAGAGIDDQFTILGALPGRLARLAFGHEKYRIPLVFPPIPRPVPFRFEVSPPVRLDLPPEAADDEAAIARAHADLWERCQAFLDASVRGA